MPAFSRGAVPAGAPDRTLIACVLLLLLLLLQSASLGLTQQDVEEVIDHCGGSCELAACMSACMDACMDAC
jgi:hypothetical protein